ncbi:unnamed protein product [Acanthoscelides obtectus]|uniref:Large ribosomal subunit protein mL37 n=1 Tax=Acanthoscelides obtectus TaxID=200917 RepID=A0A9P0JN90_ACAOB|nr:unnamed protein product [Acanthoscelides obtectus]CAK1662096.1 39S ribosomal protein L37, mitochondrial [Acanthoscelides obtectus]
MRIDHKSKNIMFGRNRIFLDIRTAFCSPLPNYHLQTTSNTPPNDLEMGKSWAMRLSPVLFRQHIGWHFEKHWRVQGKRKPVNTGVEKNLIRAGLQVIKPEDILKEKRTFEKVDVIGFKDKPQPLNATHPDWHDQVLLTFRDNNVLVEGLPQAQVLTNTLREELSSSQEASDVPEDVNQHIRTIILNSHLFDAEQKKLPKLKDPERPAWNFPRVYGVTQERRNKLIISKLLQLLESKNPDLSKDRYLYRDLWFSLPFQRNSDQIQLTLTADAVLASAKPLSPVSLEPTENLELPNIFPFEPTVTLNKENIYKLQNIYPIKSSLKKNCPHTVFVHYDGEIVKNLFEEEVTETQIFGRTLMKGFTVAASYARSKYGDLVKKLPEPITLQVVQTNGKFFHFGIFQLNTLDLDNGSVKNLWYQGPLQYLFEDCCYKLGKPVLEGYNNDVVKQLYAFYCNT